MWPALRSQLRTNVEMTFFAKFQSLFWWSNFTPKWNTFAQMEGLCNCQLQVHFLERKMLPIHYLSLNITRTSIYGCNVCLLCIYTSINVKVYHLINAISMVHYLPTPISPIQHLYSPTIPIRAKFIIHHTWTLIT